MPTYPTNRCQATHHVTEDVRGATIKLTCNGVTGHAGPHRDDTDLYWSDENWLDQMNRPWPQPTVVTGGGGRGSSRPAAPEPVDPFVKPWKSITIDGLRIPADMFLAKGLNLDVSHGHVTLTFRVREGVSVEMLSRDEAVDQARPAPDYRDAPVTLDVDHAPNYALVQLPHIHNLDGSCFKRRDGARCDTPAPRDGVAE